MAHQAFWSRASLIEYGIRFAIHPHAPDARQADPALMDTLKEERCGILTWLVRGCLAWQQLGLAIPASISLATEKYRDEEDIIFHFLTGRCVIRPEVSIKASVLYEAYKAWCEENQFGRGMNATLFGNEIGKRFEKKRVTAGMIYEGIGLLSSFEPNVGSMYTSQTTSIADETSSEAIPQETKATEHVGYVGFHHVFPHTHIKGPYEGQNREKPYIPYINTSTKNVHQATSEADGEPQKERETLQRPYIPPTITRRMGGNCPMMLMVLLTELARLEVYLSVGSDGLHVQAPSGVLTDELRQAMTEYKVTLLGYAADPAVETIDGVGYLTGNRQEQDVTFVAEVRKERLRYKVGVVLLQDGIERFYYPGMLSNARLEDIQTHSMG